MRDKETFGQLAIIRKSNMADGRHIEFTNVITIQSWIEIFAQNLIWWLRSTVETGKLAVLKIATGM